MKWAETFFQTSECHLQKRPCALSLIRLRVIYMLQTLLRLCGSKFIRVYLALWKNLSKIINEAPNAARGCSWSPYIIIYMLEHRLVEHLISLNVLDKNVATDLLVIRMSRPFAAKPAAYRMLLRSAFTGCELGVDTCLGLILGIIRTP